MGDSCSFSYPDHEDGISARRVRENNRRLALDAFRMVLGTEYPARWVDGRTALLPFDGWNLSVDVFNVPSGMQRALLRLLAHARETARGLVGSRCVFIFHTPEATAEHYKDIVAELTKS